MTESQIRDTFRYHSPTPAAIAGFPAHAGMDPTRRPRLRR